VGLTQTIARFRSSSGLLQLILALAAVVMN